MMPPQPLIVVHHRYDREAALRLSEVLHLNARVIVAGDAVAGQRFSAVIFLGAAQIVQTIGVDAFVQLRAQLRQHIVPAFGRDPSAFMFEF